MCLGLFGMQAWLRFYSVVRVSVCACYDAFGLILKIIMRILRTNVVVF